MLAGAVQRYTETGQKRGTGLTLLLIALVPTVICEVTHIVSRHGDPIATQKGLCSLLNQGREENTENPRDTKSVLLLREC